MWTPTNMRNAAGKIMSKQARRANATPTTVSRGNPSKLHAAAVNSLAEKMKFEL